MMIVYCLLFIGCSLPNANCKLFSAATYYWPLTSGYSLFMVNNLQNADCLLYIGCSLPIANYFLRCLLSPGCALCIVLCVSGCPLPIRQMTDSPLVNCPMSAAHWLLPSCILHFLSCILFPTTFFLLLKTNFNFTPLPVSPELSIR